MKKSTGMLALAGALAVLSASCAFGGVGEIKKIPETYLTMAVGSSGGGWYIMGAGLNEGWESQIPGLKMTLVPGGGASNPTLANAGTKVQLGFTYVSNAAAARNGEGKYKEAHSNLVALCNLNVKQYLNINSTKSSGLNSFDTIVMQKPKIRINVGPRGSGSEGMIVRVLETYGITYDDIKNWGGSVQYNSTDSSFNGLKDNQLEMAANSSVLGLPSLVETAAARELYFIPVGEEQGKMLAKYGFAYEPIPANTYPGQTEPVPTAVDKVVIVVNKDVPNDVVYNLTKVLCENTEKWTTVHSSFKNFDPAAAANVGIPLHPGAEEYYREAGLLK